MKSFSSTQATFDNILSRVRNRIEKRRAGLLQQVQPEERLVVTLR